MALKLAPKSVFVTGSNRGIGLEFIKQLSELPNPPKHIFAACRNPAAAKELQELASQKPFVCIVELDVTDHAQHANVVTLVQRAVGDEGLNLLINNAGISGFSGREMHDKTAEEMRTVFEVNAIAPLMLSKALLPLLTVAANKSSSPEMSCTRAAIINISSSVSSIANNVTGKSYAYRPSKTALNMITKSLSVDTKGDGILAAVIDPGWVKTDMGGQKAPLDTQTSVNGILSVLATLNQAQTGCFLDYRGEIVPW